MKLSKKLKRQLKQKLITAVASTATVITLVAVGNQAGLFASFSQLVGINETAKSMPNEYSLTSEKAANTGRLNNTATTTYIYDATDLVAFRNNVNAGNDYAGKTVYLMADIDLSSVCSKELGKTWVTIAQGNNTFAGTFDGNYHTISNLYMHSDLYNYQRYGLFSINTSTSIIRNLIMKNVQITSTYNEANAYAGGIIGVNYGKIQNCAVVSGNIVATQTGNGTSSNHLINYIGGIAGVNCNSGLISECYNKATVKANSRTTSGYAQARAGGITATIATKGIVQNCYNGGAISATGYLASVGGVVGILAEEGILKNCYNYGTITINSSGTAGTHKYIGGTLGRNGAGTGSAATKGTVSNVHCTTGTTYNYYQINSAGTGYTTVTTNRYAAATLKTKTVTLGSSFAYDVYSQNNGYPVLAWENNKTVMELNQKQAYIQTNETLQLNVEKSDAVTEKIGNNYQASNFTWKSTNEDVATVSENGVVTGLTDGYTTIYAHHEASNLYAMCIVNVSKDVANPQIGTGNGFTVILKSDGTVWSLGNNQYGQLGNGTTTNSKIPVPVKIDEDTELSNIIKIAVANEHVLALSKNGNVYTWGRNTYGQLGQNNTTSSSYAKLVLGTDGASYLKNIVEIGVGTYNSGAVDTNGELYIWGGGSYGQIGNYVKEGKKIPTKTKLKSVIQVSIGGAHVVALTSDGSVWTWGFNSAGQLGINCTDDTSYPMKSAYNAIGSIATASYHTTIQRATDGTVYSTGNGSSNQLGNASTTNISMCAKATLPSTVTGSNKVKYIQCGRMSTSLLLTDGTVWQVGYNGNGEIGNGTTVTPTNFIQGLTASQKPLENVLIVGRNLGDPASGTDDARYGLNTAVILKNGDIYTTGDNTYGQLGDNTTTRSLYYKKLGFAYLTYADKSIQVDEQGYQIDLNKLKYVSSSINAYGNDPIYEIDSLKYTSSNTNLAIVDENGKIVGVDGATGIAEVTIEDIKNGYSTKIKVIVNKLENTDSVTHIYNIEDLVAFRNSVNSGNNYRNKTVYLMADLDMSSVCSATKGSWIPIGASGTSFSGTFDGNYHTISNLYIKNNTLLGLGLFGQVSSTSTIKNVLMKNVSIYGNANTGNLYAGAVVGITYGKILNCGTISGTVTTTQNSKGTNNEHHRVNGPGGVVGLAGSGAFIDSCYNKARIKGNSIDMWAYAQSRVGGVCGYMYNATVQNCYNGGSVSATGYYNTAGGVVGVQGGNNSITKNLYNYGSVTSTGTGEQYIGGALGRNAEGVDSNATSGKVSNLYCTTGTTYCYSYFNSSRTTILSSTTGRVTPEILKGYSSKLGKAFAVDHYNINSGYPILWWETPTVELNKKQAYIKTNEKLQLNVIKTASAEKVLGEALNNTDFTWHSYNESVATVDQNALVTGLEDGYTTIWGQHKIKTDIYVICIVNVATEIASPQIETGEGFTAILKPDGTVWTIGNNAKGQLGDGTNEERIEAVQVKVNEDTYLTDIIKIAVGSNHVIALAKNGQVYAWGDNTYGQLGQNNKISSNYAKLVLGECGSGTLGRIVEISAGNYGSIAINEFGWLYVCGNGSYGESGLGNNSMMLTPVKTSLNAIVKASIGAGHVVANTQAAYIHTWGRNHSGQLGIGNTANTNTPMQIGPKASDVSASGYSTAELNLEGLVWNSGSNGSGQLGIGNTTNCTSFTKANLPSAVTETNKIAYIKAGKTTTQILLTDGTLWTVGDNTNGALGSGKSANTTSFIQAKTKEGTLENVRAIGRSNGTNTTLNTVAIGENGRVYTAGNNQYGQIGDNTKKHNNYYTAMGYTTVKYEPIIRMKVGETKELTHTNFSYTEKYFNIYREDKIEKSLVDYAKILDSNIASYESGTITANMIGSTMLMTKEESTHTLLYIPVEVLPENATVLPDSKAGENFTTTLKVDGSVWSFGTNTKGELGIGNVVNQNTPKQVSLGTNQVIRQISVGTSHTLALTENGEIYAWGHNNKGQLGMGNTKNSNLPQKVELPKSNVLVPVIQEKVVKVIANKNVSYAIMQNGEIYAWGENWATTPKLVTLEYDAIDISHNFALDINGNVYTKQGRVAIVEKIKYISESDTHAVFLSENGTAYAIGSNTFGQFGDGTNVSSPDNVVAVRNEDVTDVLRDIVRIEAGSGYTVALLSDGRIMACGKNKDGQLGTDEVDETYTIRENTHLSKLTMETAQTILFLDAGANHVVTTLSEGNVYSWGLGKNGEFGNGMNDSSYEPQKAGKDIVEANCNNLMLYPNDTFDLQASISYFNLLQDLCGEILYESKDETVVTIDELTGKVNAITPGTAVIVAKETGTSNIAVVQVRVLPPEVTVEPQVSTNGSHTVTLKGNGTVWCYGNNTNGELGDGTTNYSDKPVQAIFPEGTMIKQVAAGENFSVALDKEGNVWTWGANDYGQLGNTSTGIIKTPTKIAGLTNITKIAAGTYSVLAIDENKEVYGWGLNANGELGIGSYTNKITTPTKVKNMADVIDIATGKNHSILLKSTGEAYVTGLNLYGQLGNGDTSIKKVNQFTKVKDLNYVARITATDSGNMVALTNGEGYSWGLNIYGELGLGDKQNRSTPTQVPNMQNIILVSGGKNHSIALDKTGKIYTTGSGKYGQQGNKSYNENLTYQEVANFENGMTISAGNTYTVVAKTDGTVCGFGDYNHGDKNFKSKTNSNIPMQVGNDDFGLGITHITVKKSETVNITSHIAYSFNLIYEDKNKTENIHYESINEDIAIVDEHGDVLGVREGMTWVKAIEEDGTEHIVYVYVIDNETNYAPMIQAGEDFASVLKADGTIWTFGHNNHGELGIGSNKTKDIPEKTNVISSYQDIKTGNSFTIAIRNDRTVWSYGKNNYGQLGIGSTKNGLNPVQVSNLTDIVQIATGKEHALALDSNGILYGWGRNNEGQLGENDATALTPVPISYTEGTISSIWAGDYQSIFINTKGQVYGYGNFLNGKLEGIENAVKVVIGNNGMLILTTKGEVYSYTNGNLSQYTGLAGIIDISMTDNNVLAQTKEERVYTFSFGQTPSLDQIQNVFGIGARVNNSYVILNNGTIYAKGSNQYGQLGNSTRIDSEDFTLVGDRKFKVEPETKVMYVNDIEDVTKEMTLQEFNVFNRSITKPEEYTWTSSDTDIATVNKGKITAVSEGTAEITVKDNVTEAEVTIKRIVIPVEKDRIEKITVNDYEATIQEEYKYQVEVETNSDRGTLKVTTKNKTDKISIDNGATWKENGILTQEVELLNDITEIPIIVQTSNGTHITYTLVVKKIATDVSLETIEVNGVKATATSSTTYEVVVAEDTDILNILARANSTKAQVSINGELYNIHQATTNVKYENSIPVTMPIVVQAENGDELEYSLTIYKQSAILQLESLTVAGKDAIKTSEGVYSITVPRNIGTAEVVAKAISELVNVSIDSQNANKQIGTKNVAITDELNEVKIRLSTIVDGQEVYKDYTLHIYKKAESGKIQFVIVNGTVVTPKVNGTYEIYLPAETQNAIVKVIAQNAEDFVQITTNPKEKAQSEVTVTTPNEINQYSIEISNSETGEAETYTLYIKKPSVDNTIKHITVSNGDDIVTAKKSTEEENTYIAKVKSYDDYQIKAITNNMNAFIGIENEALVKNIVTKTITRTDDYMEFVLHTQAESGEQAEYTLKIYVMSNEVELDFIDVNGIKAVLQSDGSYLANLETAETSVTVTAQTVSEKARVKLETGNYEEHIVTGNVAIDSKDTTTYVTVEAEDGTTVRYKLVIAGLPDDANLQKVVVNGKEAKYVEGQNKYEIRLDDATFNIEAIASDSLAKVSLNGGADSVGKATITMNKPAIGANASGVIATATIQVTAQNGIEKSTYTLEMKEKSNDTSISNVQVNGKQATKLADGNYTATIQGSDTQAVIKVEATDSFATVYLDGETQNQNNITVTKQVTQRETIYTIKVKAENGTEEEHILTVTQLSNNTAIDELTVKWTKQNNSEDSETTGDGTEGSGTTEETQQTEVLTLRPDGSYYLKIDRVEEVDVKATLDDSNAMVKIENGAYVLAQNEKTIHTIAETTRVMITVKAEDGTIREYPLILEKKSNDTTLKSVTSKDMLKFENNTVYVDEDLTQVDLTFVTNSDTASIRLVGETNYMPKHITRTIDLSPKPDTGGESSMSDWVANVEVQAEDGTTQEHTIEIIKTGNVNVLSVKADNEEATKQDDTYIARVTNGTKTNVEIQTAKPNAKIEIIKQTESGEGEDVTLTETMIATGTGTLTAEVDLSKDPEEYMMRVTSAGGSSSKDYTLVLQQKSTDTRISYVKVDNLNALQTLDTEYKITVSKKDDYPFVIKLIDEKAFVKIAYKDYESEYVKGKLEGNIPVADGETLDVTMTVKAENGNEQVYHLFVTRISNNVGLEYVKVNADTITNFNATTKTYTVTVENTLTQADLEIKSIAENSKITIGGTTENGILQTVTPLGEPGTIQTVFVKVEAEDGTIENYTIKIVQLAANVMLDTVTVNHIPAMKTSETDYEVTISNKTGIASIIANTKDSTSKVAIAGEEATLQTATKEMPIRSLDDIQTTITVVAEDGVTTQDYTLTIHIQNCDNRVEYVKVNGASVTEFNEQTKTYHITVDNSLTTCDIEVKSVSEKASVTIGETTQINVIQQTVNLEGAGKTTKKTFFVTAEDGTKQEYTLEIYQKSNDTSLDKITVNGDTVTYQEDTGNYEITITDKVKTAQIIATAGDNRSKVAIGESTAALGSNTETKTITGHEVIETKVIVIAEDGTEEEYPLVIKVKESSNNIEHVKVNSGTIEPEEDKVTYQTFIDYQAEEASIEIKTVSQYTTITIDNQYTGEETSGKVVITDENMNLGVLSFKVKTPNHVTTIHYTVTSETGETKEYAIILTKVSTDASLKELYVKGELLEVNEDGSYYYTIENPEELLVKAVANNEYANIRIDYNPEEKVQTQANIMAENNTTKVTITITSQSGTTEKYYLYIKVLANNTELDRVVVDSQEVTDYEDKTKTYHAIVDNTKDTYEVFLMAVNDQAAVELFDGESLMSSGVGSVTELVTLASEESAHTYKVKVSLDEEHYSEYTLIITRTSNDTSLKLVEVNDVVRQPLDTDKFIYEVGIPKLAETAKIKVQATNPYAIVRIGDNEPVRNGTTVTIPLDLRESRITVPVVVTAVDGTTKDTFNIILLRQSNNVTIESVKVNQNELDNIDDVYTYYMPADEFKGTTEVTTVDNATIEVDGTSGIGYLEFDVDFEPDTIKVEKTIKVTSEDGSATKEYTLVIWKKTYIKGTILTENFEGKHKSTVSLYKVEETPEGSGDVQGENTQTSQGSEILGALVEQIETEEDGSFEFEISETANYKIVVTKDGYLDYTVTDIKVTPGKTITLDTYKLLAGDIVETGEIELDDLVSINEQYGLTVNYSEGVNDANVKYDFNGDGIVDAKDRNILKKNYGKKAKTVKWVDPDEVAKQAAKAAKQRATTKVSSQARGTSAYEGQFVLPLNSKYTITSNYGDRIGPITETQEKHTGIDIAGEHHAEVLSVADGEVTWAGVQNGYGNCIEVKHIVNGETIYSFYAHLSEIKVQTGDKVTQGQVIALEGGEPSTDPNPGDSTGHHLHFEIRTKSGYGNDVDPTAFINFVS